MNPSKSGLASAGKIGIVIVLIVIVLGAAYLAPSLSKGSSTQSTSSQSGNSSSTKSSSSPSTSSSSTPGGGNGPIGMLSLFKYFSQMQMHDNVSDGSEDPMEPTIQTQTIAYHVLGNAVLNSTEYVKVGFTQAAAGGDIVAWFNPQGGVDRVDVLGDKNYTGSSASIYAQIYLAAFTLVTTITNNSTLLSALTKTSESTMTIGSTQMDVATYVLAGPYPPFANITVKYATIPGTNQKLAVYLDQKTFNYVETSFEVTDLTK